MGIITPLALALLALALPIVLLYMLRLRRPPAPVSSILLWEAVLADLEANAPWQRLRRNWLLLLQLLILLLLVLALARPFATSAGRATGNAIVVLDASASMRATDVAPSRFERARAEAAALVDGLGVDRRMALVLAGAVPEVLQAPTADRAALRRALDQAQPGYGIANMADAVALAVAAGQRLPDSQIIIISDGAFPPLDPAAVPVPLRVLTVGASADNLALTALATRPNPRDGGNSLFVRVRNTDATPRSSLLSIYADERLIDAREVVLEGEAETGITVEAVPPGTRLIRAELEAPDALAVDNRAWIVPAADTTRVLLVSRSGSAFLRRGLALLPGMSLFQTDDPAPQPGYDWYVFDGVLPERLPGNSLIIDPPPGSPLLPVTGMVDQPPLGRVARDHPLLAGVDLAGLHLARAVAVSAPPWAEVLAEAGGAPLLLAGEQAGQRVAVLAFDLHQSDLPLQVAFPVLLSNLHAWLRPAIALDGAAPDGVTRPGDLITLRPGAGIDEAVVTDPAGRQRSLPVSNGAVRLADTTLTGPYTFSLRAGGVEQRAIQATVNLLSDAESSIAPIMHPPLGAATSPPATLPEPAQQELWRPLLMVGILLLLAEWWFFYRGMPRLRKAMSTE